MIIFGETTERNPIIQQTKTMLTWAHHSATSLYCHLQSKYQYDKVWEVAGSEYLQYPKYKYTPLFTHIHKFLIKGQQPTQHQ